MNKKITLRKGQVGLLVKAGDYTDILEAGEHRLSWFGKQEVTIVELNGSDVAAELANYLRRFRPEWVEEYCLSVDTTGH